MGELTRFLIDLYRRSIVSRDNSRKCLGTVETLLGLLEQGMSSSDSALQELVSVSFLENLNQAGELYADIKKLLFSSYDGLGWYRTTVKVPGKFAGRKINLGFGGVFGRILIWVNGEFIAYRPFKLPWWTNGYNKNFDFEITKAVKPGQDNTIVIRVDNEHEWGGIYRRVSLWSPKPSSE